MKKVTKQRLLIILAIEVTIVFHLLLVIQREGTPPPHMAEQMTHYIYDNVYFEYPISWNMRTGPSDDVVTLTPSPNSPEAREFDVILVMFIPDLIIENWEQTYDYDTNCMKRLNIKWRFQFNTESFSGFECVWEMGEERSPVWEYLLYNEDTHTWLGILAALKNKEKIGMLNSPEAAKYLFPNIVHIAESAQIR